MIMKNTNKCGTCKYLFDSEWNGQSVKSLGECDNRYSPCCGEIVFYDTPACDEYEKEDMVDFITIIGKGRK